MSLFLLSTLLLPSILAIPHKPVHYASNSTTTTTSLDPNCAPGGNFDLSLWKLQLPTGKQGSIDSISSSSLTSCDGYQSSKYFFTSPDDGALVMKVAGSPDSSGCVATSGSKHCRTELRESSPSSWDAEADMNRLKVELEVVKPDDGRYGTVIGQIHADGEVSNKPVCELFYGQDGKITMGVEQVPGESSLKYTGIGSVTVGERFGYEIRFEKGKLQVSINDGGFKMLSTGELGAPRGYFKVGNYNQGDEKSEVRFYKIEVEHS
ncbi:alginate lyase 2 [Delitschia confertaspora ATCC 74209]|uniref:Alginate lyase 2 n=1 Tax=Delitschia confertaspora ATCC 74209 TaxID=1513339 RepID=A0A9P4MPJ3_9PLEO|nr:alginate lyase 2 [Delitschia confertaspora ATCC 74209]